MLTITPARRSIIDGSTALLQRNTLFSTTDTSRSHVGSSISSTSSPSAIAALLTSTSTGPRREVTSPTIVATSAPTLTSRSEEHTSELQSPCNLVCRLLLEKRTILVQR